MYVNRLCLCGYQVIDFCGITGISKIELLNFFGSKKVKQNQNILKTVGKLLDL